MDDNRAYLLTEYKIWVQRNGDPIPVEKMTDNHLVCTLRLLKRSAQAALDRAANEYVKAAPVVSQLMGDAAQDAFDSEFDRLLDTEWQDIDPDAFAVLVDEAGNRKLDWESSPWY